MYPDISDLFKEKARRRHALMALSWEEKVRVIERMQRLLPKGAWQISKSQSPATLAKVANGELLEL